MSASDLVTIKEYIRKQAEHHRKLTFRELLMAKNTNLRCSRDLRLPKLICRQVNVGDD